MPENKMMYKCFICGGQFKMGPHEYDGKYIKSYDISVCMPCYQGNWDGWAPPYEQKLLAHLKNKGLSIPARNSKDLLPRE